MKSFAFLSLLALSSQFAFASNIKIVKSFDGLNARCGETADLGNAAYRLKNGAVVIDESSLTFKVRVDSLVCAQNRAQGPFTLVGQAPSEQNKNGITTKSHKLVITNDNYQVIAAAALDKSSPISDLEMTISLNDAQKSALKNGEKLNLEAFIQYFEVLNDESSLSGSGSFNISIQDNGNGSGSVSIR